MSAPPKRVFVTGAGGFVGSHLVRTLNARGMSVTGAGLAPPASSADFERWFDLDVRDISAGTAAIEQARPDAVVHLAAQSSAARSFEDPVGTFQTNVLGTWSVLEAVRAACPRARVLAVGSGEVYGPQPEGSLASEDTPVRPVSPYALSKAVSEAMALAYAETHGLDVVCTRSFGHTGPGQPPTFVLPAFAQQVAAIERHGGEPVLRVGNLDVTRDLSDVRDVVEAYVLLLERGRCGQVFNVGSGQGVKLTRLVDMLAHMSRVPLRIEVDAARVRPADVSYLVGDPAKLTRETGWRPNIPLEQSVAEVLAAWRVAS